MSVKWLAFQSYQHSQELISAINTLLIHLKLKESGIADDARNEKAKKALDTILSFFESFEFVVSDVTNGKSKSGMAKATLGTDMRLRQLAKNYIKATKNHRRFQSDLFKNTISGFRKSLEENDEKNRDIWIKSLEEMRFLVEEHLNDDIEEVLGES